MRKVSFLVLLEVKMSPYDYINVLYVQILIWDHNNFARVTSEPKIPNLRIDLGKLDIRT